jgi:Na+/H+ antiporter NhaA
MQKLVLLSVIIASLVIPIRATNAKNPVKGLKRALGQMVVFGLIYLFLLMYVWARVG